jgi:hypothetical protein
MCFAEPTRVSSAFQKNSDGIDVSREFDALKIHPDIVGRDTMAVLLEILSPLDGRHLTMSTHKSTHPKSVDNDRFPSDIVNHIRKRDGFRD